MIEQSENKEILKLRSIMSPKVETVTPRASALSVCRLMARRRISCVVVASRGRIAGIIAERDIVRRSAVEGGLENVFAKDIMSAPVQTFSPDTTLERATAIISQQGPRQFPIVEKDGSLIGIVTQTDVMRAFNRQLEMARDQLRDLALRDCLTGMYNRRFFMASMEREFFASRRHNTPLSLLLMDLDDFKDVNDLRGHQYGDQVLRTVADIIRKQSRASDIAARFGGEEFTLLLPSTGLKEAGAVAERILAALRDVGQKASLGVSVFPKYEARYPDDFIRQADTAMYKAKSMGKDRVVLFKPSFSTEKKNEP